MIGAARPAAPGAPIRRALGATLRPAELRLRLVATLWAVAVISQLTGLAPAAVALAGALGLAAAQGGVDARRLLHLEAFLILLFLTLPFTTPGRALAQIGPLTATAEGLTRAASLGARTGAAVLLIATALAGESPARLGAALRGLRLPEALVRLFLATAHYLELTRAEALRLREAMRARAFRAGSNRHTWRSLGNLIGMLFLRALARAARVEEAMRARGYAGQMPARALPRPGARDWAAALTLAALTTALLIWDRHA